MNWRLSVEKAEDDIDRHQRIEAALSPATSNASNYIPTEQIIHAVNTAIQLGKPLLVSGEPGTGKTQLAYYIAMRLGLFDRNGKPEVLRFDVKSITKGADLTYRYDAIGHFRNSQKENKVSENEAGPDKTVKDFVELEALGKAIVLSQEPSIPVQNDDLRALVKEAQGENHVARTSVVLIDEIDKAPRDVPNDLLRELDEMAFKIPEFGPEALFACDPESRFRPIVLLTTNEERGLPDAFLRRCCYLHIAFPDPEQLRNIIREQLGSDWQDESLCGDAIKLVNVLRNETEKFSKKPGTAELLDYLLSLRSQGARPSDRLMSLQYAAKDAKAIFCKNADDGAEVDVAFGKLNDVGTS